MPDVTNLELSRELYKVSGWDDQTWWFDGSSLYLVRTDDPAYDLGFLIRKLPVSVQEGFLGFWKAGEENYTCGYINDDNEIEHTESDGELFEAADTPENALAQLAITLIKQNILVVKEDK